MKQVVLAQDVDQLAHRAMDWLFNLIREHQANHSSDFTLALAGGATPKALYQLMARSALAPSESAGQNAASKDALAGEIDWGRVVFLWGDERNVPHDHADSNYRMAWDNLLSRVPVRNENILPVQTQTGDAEQAALHYEATLRGRLSQAKTSDFGEIDCILLGIGDDVHTASLFPETTALEENSRWVVSNYVPKLDAWRITFTAPLINAAKQIAFFIAGANKSSALNTLWHGSLEPKRYPAQMVNPLNGDLTFFVDQAAVANLKIPDSFRKIS